ncbi:general secretion pathway protein I [Yersinia frederiksenii]|nr:general secretion pathway protein I [Yersinia frederiksenii]
MILVIGLYPHKKIKRMIYHNIKNHHLNIHGGKRYCVGFTLLEVMVSMAIFATLGISMMKIMSGQLLWVKSLEDKMVASWVADNILAEINLMRIEQTENWSTGDELMMNKLWYWQSKEISSGNGASSIVTVEIRSQTNSNEPDFIIEGYRSTNE